MKNKPVFSVVTPVLNGMPYIKENIESIKNQDVSVEHIIYDGGSTDGTVEYLKTVQDIIFINEEDKGQTDAIRKGLNIANGRYLNWINADDKLRQNILSSVLKSFNRHPDCNIVSGDGRIINKDGIFMYAEKGQVNDKECFPFLYYLFQPSTWFTRELYDKVKGVNSELHYCMDADIYWRITLQNEPIIRISEIWSDFRLHDRSKTVKHSEKFYSEWRDLLISKGFHSIAESYYASRLGDIKLSRSAIDSINNSNLKEGSKYFINGILYSICKEKDLSKKCFEKAVDTGSNSLKIMTINKLIREAWNNKDLIETARLRNAAYSIIKNIPEVDNSKLEILRLDYIYASLLQYYKKYEKAFNIFSRIIGLEKMGHCFSGGAWFHIGQIYKETGAKNKAEETFAKVLKILPLHARAKKELQDK